MTDLSAGECLVRLPGRADTLYSRLLRSLTSSPSSLQGIVQASLPIALASFVSSRYALLFAPSSTDKEGGAVLATKKRKSLKFNGFRLKKVSKMKEERMRQAQYPTNHGGPSGDYLIFRFDEEVSIGHFDINALIVRYRLDHPEYIYGSPIYPTGEELLKYKV